MTAAGTQRSTAVGRRGRTTRAGTLAFVVALSTTAALTAARGGPARAAAPPPPAAPDAIMSPTALDAEAQQRARRSYAAAEAHFKAGNFREALAEYKAGYDAAALPGFLINIAQCQRRLGDLAGALTTYRRFVLVAPDSPFVPQVQGMIQELEKLGPEVTQGAEATAAVPPSAAAGLAAPPPASPPRVLIDSSEAPAAQPSSKSSSGKTWWVVGGVAAAAVIGGTAAVFALRSGDSTTTVHDGTLGTLRR